MLLIFEEGVLYSKIPMNQPQQLSSSVLLIFTPDGYQIVLSDFSYEFFNQSSHHDPLDRLLIVHLWMKGIPYTH